MLFSIPQPCYDYLLLLLLCVNFCLRVSQARDRNFFVPPRGQTFGELAFIFFWDCPNLETEIKFLSHLGDKHLENLRLFSSGSVPISGQKFFISVPLRGQTFGELAFIFVWECPHLGTEFFFHV
jgi:hypothetical protein